MNNQRPNGIFRGVLAGTLASAALAGFNYLSKEASIPPKPMLGGEFLHYSWRMGQIAYHVDGPKDGPPHAHGTWGACLC